MIASKCLLYGRCRDICCNAEEVWNPGQPEAPGQSGADDVCRFVLPPLGQLRFGLAGHISVIIGGVEEQTIGRWRLSLPDALKEQAGNGLQIGFADTLPFLPVAFAGEFVKVNWPDMLDGGFPVPVGQLVFTDGLHHPVKHAIKKILTHRRPGFSFGLGNNTVGASFEIIRNLCQKLPVMVTPRWVGTLTQPISVDDVLSYLQESIELAYSQNLIVDIGTEPLTFQQMMQQAAAVMGLKRYLFPVPILSPRLSSYWLILFTPIPYKLASSLVEGLKSETLVQNDNAHRFYPQISPHRFDESVALALQELELNQVISRWCDSSGNQACDIKDFNDPAGAIFRDTRVAKFSAGLKQEAIFETICSLGGSNGWFKYNILWRVRGVMDKVVGGYGLNRGRRLHKSLRIGDALDFWKVVDIHEGKRLLLYAQMRIPGKAWLEFDVQPQQLVQTAHFLPKGILGRLYWYLLSPIHYFVFNDLAQSIIKKSEVISKTQAEPAR